MDEDLELIKLRHHKMDQENQNIYDKVFMNGELISFSKKEFFEGRMKVMLPDDFIDMPRKVAQFKYPNEARPDIIKTDLIGATNFTFSLLKGKAKEEELPMIIETTRKMIGNYQPQNVFYENMDGSTQSGKYALIQFKSFAIDMPIYQIMYYTLIEGRVMHGIFNCRFEEKEMWEKIAIQVIESIEEVKKDEI